MRAAQVIIFETDGALADQIGELARENGWLIRESRQVEACLKLVREARPSILLLKLHRRLVDELSLLLQVQEKAPDCPVVVVSDVKLENAAQRAQLAGLAYDLGARCVLFPPIMPSSIEDLAAGLMEAAIVRYA